MRVQPPLPKGERIEVRGKYPLSPWERVRVREFEVETRGFDTLLLANQLSKSYGSRKVLDSLTLEVKRGEIVLICGLPSSGKTTVVRLCLIDETPTGGTIRILGHESPGMKRKEISLIRRKIGAISEEARLLRDRSVLENVMLPLMVDGKKGSVAKALAIDALSKVGLSGSEKKFPDVLSLSERKRVALGRAIVRSPELLILDEPFSGLGKSEQEGILKLVSDMAERGTGVLLTSSPESSPTAEGVKVFHLCDGSLISSAVVSEENPADSLVQERTQQ